jgi:hypothetical protein
MSERQEIYHYTVDKESATQQQHMASGAFAIVRPHLEIEAQGISRAVPDFQAALQAFLADPSDPTGLKLFNLRDQASALSRTFATVSSLLGQLAGNQEEEPS